MPLWLEDATYHLANALRGVFTGLAAVLWASLLTLHVQAPTATRGYFLLAAIVVSVTFIQFLGGLPPSVTVVDTLQPMEKDILAAAREKAGGDSEMLHFLAARVATHAAVSVRHGNAPPRDRRAWLRAIATHALSGDTAAPSRDGRAAD